MFKEKLNDYGIYEYRGFKYTEEFKKTIKIAGLRLKIIIDNFLDLGIDKIILESKFKIQTMHFLRSSFGNDIKITTENKNEENNGSCCIYG